MKIIAIIPARSGSKGLKDKNIMPLCGKPLMNYTIEAALKSGCFSTVMVSTDSNYYAQIAVKSGAEVPFLRSEEMSSDSASSWDTVREVLEKYSEQGITYDYVALLQPTSPLRNEDDIKGVVGLLRREGVKAVVTVTEVDHPVQWCFTMPADHSMHEFAKSPFNYMRRQDLEVFYRENGAVFLVNAQKIMNPGYNFYADGCFGYIMPRDRSTDIDSEIDFKLAEILIKRKC